MKEASRCENQLGAGISDFQTFQHVNFLVLFAPSPCRSSLVLMRIQSS